MALRTNSPPAISFGLSGALAAALLAVAAACAPMVPPKPAVTAALRLNTARFSELAGWGDTDLAPAFAAFLRSCVVLGQRPESESLGGAGYAGTAGEWREACAQAANTTPGTARAFFESAFVPYRVDDNEEGLFTGYYEPELNGSRSLHGNYATPLYARPSDLVMADLGLFRESLKGQRIDGRVVNGRLVPYAARAEIARDGLQTAKVLFWVDDPIAAFFLQIQGSGRVRLDDGTIVRAAYAGENGQPYTAIGAVLVRRGEMKREDVSLQSIRAWIAAHPGEAQALMNENASYVFFSEQPIGDPALGATGSEGVPLTPAASMAVDPAVHALGVPVFLEATAPDADAAKPDRAFDRLLVMQDTGGAIRGTVRGDVYWGFGADAEFIAGRMRAQGHMTVLLPKRVAARLGPRAEFPAAQR